MAATSYLKLEEQLTCAVCLDLYTSPKTLPCLHSFCQDCLERLPLDKKNDTHYLTCPTCRHHTELPEKGVGAFPVAFHLNNLREMRSLLRSDILQIKQANCDVHEKPLEIFCETCNVVICVHCTFHSHKSHEYDLITNCYPGHHQKLEKSLSLVTIMAESVENTMLTVIQREAEIIKRRDKVLAKIHEKVEEMIYTLRQSERKLTEQANKATDAKLKVLSEQEKAAEKTLSLLKDVEDYVGQSLKTGTPQQVLRSKKEMMERMSEVTTEINVEELQPLEKVDLEYLEDDEIVSLLSDIGTVTYTILQQYEVKRIAQIGYVPEEKQIYFDVALMPPDDSSYLSVPTSSIRCSLVPTNRWEQTIHTTVTTTDCPGVYRILFASNLNRGTHTVKVEIYGFQLENTSLVVPFNPYLAAITPLRIITGLNRPWAVAVSQSGRIVVTEWGANCVTIFTSKGTRFRSFGHKEDKNIQFSSPRGVAIDKDDFIFVSDDHRVSKLTMAGIHIASVGKEGSGPQQFRYPENIFISPIAGNIYVADFCNNRIQVLSPSLTFFQSIGPLFTSLYMPTGIAIDSQGLINIAQFGSGQIHIFTAQGDFVRKFGIGGRYALAIDDTGLVYVSSFYGDSHYISVYTKNGRYIRSFGKKNPKPTISTLSFDKEGFLYVCNFSNNEIVLY